MGRSRAKTSHVSFLLASPLKLLLLVHIHRVRRATWVGKRREAVRGLLQAFWHGNLRVLITDDVDGHRFGVARAELEALRKSMGSFTASSTCHTLDFVSFYSISLFVFHRAARARGGINYG